MRQVTPSLPVVAVAFPALLLCVGLLALGVMLWFWGWRGRVIDDHPICRRCGFDLFGKPETSTRCPECGSDVDFSQAIRIGHRRRQGALMWSGIALSFIAVGFLSLATWVRVRNIDLVTYKPVWWLLWDTDSASTRDIALNELIRRINANSLSAVQVSALADKALAMQADRTKPWDRLWGDAIEDLRAKKRLSDKQWERYARQSYQAVLKIRPNVRRGDEFPWGIGNTQRRTGSTSRSWRLQIRYHIRRLILSTATDVVYPFSSGNAGREMSPGTTSYLAPDLRLWRRLADGKHTAEAEGEALVVEGSYNGPVISRQPLKVQATWTLHAADDPTVHAVNDPSYRAAVEKAVRVGHAISYLGVWSNGPPHIEVSKNGYATIEIKAAKPPVNLACKIILRAGSRQWVDDAGVYFHAGRDSGWCTACRAPGLLAHQVDVILRPSARVATRTFDLTSYWNGELVFHNVPVDYEKPATKPATRAATIPSPAAKR